MAGLRRSLGFFLSEGRLVHQKVGADRCVRGRVARTRVAGDHEPASWSGRTDEIRRVDLAPVIERDAHVRDAADPTCGPSGHAHVPRAIRVEATESQRLDQREAERRRARMVGGEGRDRVAVAANGVTRRELAVLDGEAYAVRSERLCATKYFRRPGVGPRSAGRLRDPAGPWFASGRPRRGCDRRACGRRKCRASENATPYRIIWRWVPSPQSKRNVSPSRTTAMELTLRSTVGREADVPRKRRESDTSGI